MTKALFILLRGVRLFFNYFKSNLLSVLALSALFLVLHTVFGLGSGMADFARSAADFDTIRAYVDNSSAVNATEEAVKAIDGVESTLYYPPDQTKKYIKDNAPGLDGVDKLADDLFPPFLMVTVAQDYREISQLEELSAKIAAVPNISYASYGKEWVQTLTDGKNAVLSLLAIVSILFGLICAVIIYQTVSVTLFRYRKDVRIYNIAGGTAFFIIMPFVVTACLTGIICSLLSLLLYLVFRATLLSSIEAVLGLNLAVSSTYIWVFLLLATVISVLAGAISAFLFLRNHEGGNS